MGTFKIMKMKFKTFCAISLMEILCGTVDLYSTEKAVASQENQNTKSEKPALVKNTPSFDNVKRMYAEFVSLVGKGVSDADMDKFFTSYFDVNGVTARLMGARKNDAKLTKALLNYFKFLLNGEIIKQVKNYKLSDEFSQITKKNSIIILCKLNMENKSSTNSVLDMSVTFSAKNNKILELSFMKSVYLIKGAKNIIDLYCQENAISLRKKKIPERIDICVNALNAYILKQSSETTN